jgi:hypothetical protein
LIYARRFDDLITITAKTVISHLISHNKQDIELCHCYHLKAKSAVYSTCNDAFDKMDIIGFCPSVSPVWYTIAEGYRSGYSAQLYYIILQQKTTDNNSHLIINAVLHDWHESALSFPDRV